MIEINNGVQGKKTILLVEDEQILNNLIKVKLKKAGVEIIGCKNADEALDVLSRMSPDLIWLDLYLKGTISGFNFLKEIRNNPATKDLKVVVVSASASTNDETKLRKEFNVLDYFVKSNNDLDGLVKKIIFYLK